MTRYSLLLTFLAGALLTGCSSSTHVGRFKLSKKDFEQRDAVIKVFYPKEKRSLGKKQLVDAYTLAEILLINGQKLDESILQAEQSRIDRETQDPVTLSKIKAIFGADTEAYRRVFVLPTYVERVIYFDFFTRDPKIQSEPREKAQSFLTRALEDSKTFETLSKSWQLQVHRVCLNPTQGVTLEDPAQNQPDRPEADAPAPQVEQDIRALRAKEAWDRETLTRVDKWKREIVRPLKPGQVFRRVVEESDGFWVVRKAPATPKPACPLEAVVFAKSDYETWLKTEKAKVSVRP